MSTMNPDATSASADQQKTITALEERLAESNRRVARLELNEHLTRAVASAPFDYFNNEHVVQLITKKADTTIPDAATIRQRLEELNSESPHMVRSSKVVGPSALTPQEQALKESRELFGSGSDARKANNMARNFPERYKLLRQIALDEGFYGGVKRLQR